MVIWKAHYKDKFHDEDIEIINTQEERVTSPLSFTVDGITFSGGSIGDFELQDTRQYDLAEGKFCLLKRGGNHKDLHVITPYYYDLQRYTMEIYIPIAVVRKKDGCKVEGMIDIAFQLVEQRRRAAVYCDDIRVYQDDEAVLRFSLTVEGRVYESSVKSLYFERALKDISKQIQADYYIQSCFTCQYADYSPYGSDNYGTMLCYRRYKEDYLKVNDKDSFFEYLEIKDCDVRQEDFLCQEYAIRNQCRGYRGFVEECQ
ncbi:MAG: DUF6304 family protein [Clostridium sp.]|nr:DUF6304 family protein [Clostridium sp.]